MVRVYIAVALLAVRVQLAKRRAAFAYVPRHGAALA